MNVIADLALACPPSSRALRDLLLGIAYPGEPAEGSTTLSDAFAVALRRNRNAVQTMIETRLSVDRKTLPDYYRLYFGIKRTRELEVIEHIVPNLTDDDINALISVLDRNNRLGLLKGASEEARRRAFRDRCGRQLLVAMIEATTGERFEEKIVKELSSLPGLQQFIYGVLCTAGRERHYLTRDEILLSCQNLPGGDPLDALALLVRRNIVTAPPPGTAHRPRHTVIADVVFESMRREGQIAAPLMSLVYALASKAEPHSARRDRVWRLLTRLINHDYLLSVIDDITQARELYAPAVLAARRGGMVSRRNPWKAAVSDKHSAREEVRNRRGAEAQRCHRQLPQARFSGAGQIPQRNYPSAIFSGVPRRRRSSAKAGGHASARGGHAARRGSRTDGSAQESLSSTPTQ